jgi:hypothetical protein
MFQRVVLVPCEHFLVRVIAAIDMQSLGRLIERRLGFTLALNGKIQLDLCVSAPLLGFAQSLSCNGHRALHYWDQDVGLIVRDFLYHRSIAELAARTGQVCVDALGLPALLDEWGPRLKIVEVKG